MVSHKSSALAKNTQSSSDLVKRTHHIAKRAGSASSNVAAAAAAAGHQSHMGKAAGMNGKYRRVSKACERCRMKKAKCDDEFPCKRCKDVGLVCTASVRKKLEYKKPPQGYAEVLENMQFSLIDAVHKLYSMVRNEQLWEFGEPAVNDRGQPIVHNIVQKLGCIYVDGNVDLPNHSIFPEDEGGMQELSLQLEAQQRLDDSLMDGVPAQIHTGPIHPSARDTESSSLQSLSSSHLDHPDLGVGHCGCPTMVDRCCNKSVTTSSPTTSPTTSSTTSPQSLRSNNVDCNHSPSPPALNQGIISSSPNSTTPTTLSTSCALPIMPSFEAWDATIAMHLMNQQSMIMQNTDMLAMEPQGYLSNHALTESEFSTLRFPLLSSTNEEIMMDCCDPMILSRDYNEKLSL